MTTWTHPTGHQVDLGERIARSLGHRMSQNTSTKFSMQMDPDKDGAYIIYIGWRRHTGYDSEGWCKEINSILDIRIKLDENSPITLTYAPYLEVVEGVRLTYGVAEEEIQTLLNKLGPTLEYFNPMNFSKVAWPH